MLEQSARKGFRFDAVQMPLNVMDAHFDSFEKKVIPILQQHQIGILGMKPLAEKFILDSKTVSPVEGLHYAMDLPVSTVITGCDTMDILEQALKAARTFQPLRAEERSSLLARTAEAAAKGEYELYKTATRFDATSRNPHWLGL
jgi:aryl-alcohol dehydrogenase-like predicted oxidoreductase